MAVWLADATVALGARHTTKLNGASAKVHGFGRYWLWYIFSPAGTIVRSGSKQSQADAESKAVAIMDKLFP